MIVSPLGDLGDGFVIASSLTLAHQANLFFQENKLTAELLLRAFFLQFFQGLP